MAEEVTAYSGLVTARGLRLMERTGWAMFAAWACMLVVWGYLVPDPYATGAVRVVELMFFGRAVCIYNGESNDFSPLYMIAQAGPQDVILLLAGLPWVVRLYERATHSRLLYRTLHRVARAAEAHRHNVNRFGAVGLFLFVFFPVSSSGTLVGGTVGYLLGMPVRPLLTIVILGHLTSCAALIYFFDWLEPLLLTLDSRLAKYFAWIMLVALFLLGWLYSWIKGRFGKKRDSAVADAVQKPDVGVDPPE